MYQVESDRGERGSVDASLGTPPAGQRRAENSDQTWSDYAIALEEAKICARLKALRLSRRIDLKTLAALSGFTEAQLLGMESDVKAPPFATLARLGRCLGVELGYFFAEREPLDERAADRRVSIVRHGERKPRAKSDVAPGIEHATLAHPVGRKSMEPLLFSFSAHAQHDYFFEHSGEEFVYVLEGELDFEIVIDGSVKKFSLGAGDSFYFEAALPHRYFSTATEAKALMIVANQDGGR
ncbi:XRE family transcriptional regulator [Paraburkholderia sp. JHI869]|uniref:helix-turn-helix domain-containing protein n=1 Tax=Paraburkholderia sp. JHI869 TaxID=3112959 RepID=UPI0031793C55